MTPAWTPEPWKDYPDMTIRTRGTVIADCHVHRLKNSQETCQKNAARIVACVNGCAGLNPAAYRAVVEALRKIDDLAANLACTSDISVQGREARRQGEAVHKIVAAALTRATTPEVP